MYVAGIDIGTTSVCCVVADAAGGGVIHTAMRANDARLPSARSWEELQQPGRIVRLAEELIASCGDLWKHVAAIDISCQMHGIVYVDGNGDAVGPLITWQDRRGDERLPSGETYAAWLAAQTGYRVATGYGLVTHLYNVRNGEVPAGAAALCSIGDYVAMKLCGARRPLTDGSIAASFGLYSLRERAFDCAALAAAGIDAALLPELASDGGIVGRTPDGKPVVCAIGDNQASFLGAVPQLEHTLLMNVGTGAQASVYADRPADSAALETRPFPGGGCLLVGASLGGGKSYALLERFFRETCRLFAGGDAGEGPLYERMNRVAEEALDREGVGGACGGEAAGMRGGEAAGMRGGEDAGTHGGEDAGVQEPVTAPPLAWPRVRTQFYGTRDDPAATGAIEGITHRNFTPQQLVVGFLDGIVDELIAFVQLLPDELRRQLAIVCGSGNGVRRNPAMRRLLRRRLQLPFYVSAVEEEAAFGAAIYAAACSGLFPDVRAALAGMQVRGGAEA